MVSLEGYELASIFSRTSNLHGGSCIMVKEGNEYVELEYLKNKSIFTNAEEYKIAVVTSALADHFAQQISIPNNYSKRESLKARKIIFTHNNLIQLRHALEKTDWSPVVD
ncbi:hypothetical protein QE152_g5441 [Popillia japonica]|uniref:Uncharacterized protein n=1 Tax=Popillia japonica TaxID=7064 RepID=A0AAW1MND4_POPJA